MEQLPRDVLVYMAMMLDLPDILSLCNSNSKFNEKVCNNEQFWYNKIRQDYPDINNLDKYGSTYRQIYRNIKYPIEIKLVITVDELDGSNVTGSTFVVMDKITMGNMGKFIQYIVSEFSYGIVHDWESFIVTIFNKDNTEENIKKCYSTPWNIDSECFDNINYTTTEVRVIMKNHVNEDDVEDRIYHFSSIIDHVRENFTTDPADWPSLWL